MMKTCTKCNIDKPLDNFNKNKNTKDGFCIICKLCRKEYYNENYKGLPNDYYIRNKEKINEKKRLYGKTENRKKSNKKYYESNLEKVRENNKKWVNNNPEKNKENKEKWYKDNPSYQQKYRETNSEKNKTYQKIYRKEYSKNNKEKINSDARNYRNKNPHIGAWRTILRNSLNRIGKKKDGHTIDLLGYSAIELSNHISNLFTEGMSWSNYGEWHIDHIKLISEFDKDTHPSIVNALCNLRPLWATTREINGVVYEGNLNRPKR